MRLVVLLYAAVLCLGGCMKKTVQKTKRSINPMDRFLFQRDWADIGMPLGTLSCTAPHEHIAHLTVIDQSLDRLVTWYRRQLLVEGWDLGGQVVTPTSATLVGIKPSQSVVIILTQEDETVSKKAQKAKKQDKMKPEQMIIKVELYRCLVSNS